MCLLLIHTSSGPHSFTFLTYMYISWKILFTCPKYHSTCGLILFRSCQFMSSQLFLQLDCQHIYRNKRKGYKNLNITNSFSEPLNSSIILPSPKTMERKTFLIIVFSCLAASKGKESFWCLAYLDISVVGIILSCRKG